MLGASTCDSMQLAVKDLAAQICKMHFKNLNFKNLKFGMYHSRLQRNYYQRCHQLWDRSLKKTVRTHHDHSPLQHDCCHSFAPRSCFHNDHTSALPTAEKQVETAVLSGFAGKILQILRRRVIPPGGAAQALRLLAPHCRLASPCQILENHVMHGTQPFDRKELESMVTFQSIGDDAQAIGWKKVFETRKECVTMVRLQRKHGTTPFLMLMPKMQLHWRLAYPSQYDSGDADRQSRKQRSGICLEGGPRGTQRELWTRHHDVSAPKFCHRHEHDQARCLRHYVRYCFCYYPAVIRSPGRHWRDGLALPPRRPRHIQILTSFHLRVNGDGMF